MSRGRLTRRAVVAALAASSVAACTETIGDFNPSAPPRARAPAGLPVALVSLEGGPEQIVSRLSVAMARQAARRDIQIVGVDGNPRYRVRGYVAAHADGGEGLFSWTFDIFDERLKRARRVAGEEKLRAAGDPWEAVTDQHLEAAAVRAADDIAEFLASQPTTPVAGAVGAAGRRAAGLLAGH